jgi:hypothetical protein
VRWISHKATAEKKICFLALRTPKEASNKAELTKRVYPHLLPHSDAIKRLKQTRNSKDLQPHYLSHSSTVTTMKYLNTLIHEDAVKINQEVVLTIEGEYDFERFFNHR